MGKIVISTNMSLDGVVQDPDGAEGYAQGGWFTRAGARNLEEWAKIEFAESLATEALLLGRRSDEWFATRWELRTGDWADRLNGLPKFIVSSTLAPSRWGNATVLNGDLADEVSRLKQTIDGDIVVYASYQLGRALLERDLVDEVRLFVFPVVVGGGVRLFGNVAECARLRLVQVRTVGDDLAFLTYRRVLNSEA
jgi:dihydrofolate reductase